MISLFLVNLITHHSLGDYPHGRPPYLDGVNKRSYNATITVGGNVIL